MKKTTLWALAILASAWGIAADLPSYLEGDWGALANTIGGPAFAVAGATAAVRRPQNRTGTILLLTAFVWPLGSLYKHDGLAFQQAALIGGWLWVIPVFYLVLAFPSCRLERRKDRFLCWLVSVPVVWLTFLELPLFKFTPEKPIVRPGAGPLLEAIETIILITAIASAGMLTARVREKWRRASPPERRALAPVMVTGAASMITAALLVMGLNYVPFVKDNLTAFSRITWLVAATVPLGFLLGLARARARRARMGELVIELGELPTPERFQAALRNALGDPSLVAAFWVPAVQRYLTPEGQALDLPGEEAGPVATFLERGGEPLAVIVHDPFLMEDPGLVAGATAAARLAVENERLQHEILEQLSEVRASRSRIIKAGDDARRRLERDIHDGAQQRLVTLGLQLQRLATKLGPVDGDVAAALNDARTELKSSLRELRDLARGLHPIVLAEEGLAAALETVAGRSSVPVVLGEVPSGRFPESIETAAYFVVSEALANVAKHAHATTVHVSIVTNNQTLSISVADDGIGGASLTAGSGLRGLVERVHALDGTMSVSSPVGQGTHVNAQLPTDVPRFEVGLPWETPLFKEPVLAERREQRVEAPNLLAVRGLDVFYGEQQILFDIDIAVAAGEVVALLGTNGAGKSTLVRTLAGLHDPLRGSIRFQGRDLTDVMAERRSRAGLVFVEGGAGIFAPLTVEENIKLFGRHAGISFEDSLTKTFDVFPALSARRANRAGAMSRGEQHMLALARAVICEASLVIVDELSLGLAPAAINEVYEQIRLVNASGAAVLFVEQSVTLASQLSPRAYFLDAGRVTFEGRIADLESSGLLVPAWMRNLVPARA